ncbi:MAG: flagellar hook-associated protein FlgK [Phycisphaerales bacterium]
MSLTSSLLIGRSALSASQVALQVTGNNIANAATPGYSRQRVLLDPIQGRRITSNSFAGNGVGVESVRRVVNPALAQRLRSSISQESSAGIEVNITSAIENITRELTGADLSSQLSAFFNSFSELANNPASGATRATVIEQGAGLATFVRNMRADLLQERGLIENELRISTLRADEILGDIADLNRAITTSEVGSGEDGSLRDQRDALLDELSSLIDITVIEQDSGSIDVLTDSTPLVQGTTSRGLELDIRSVASGTQIRVRTKEDPETITSSGGTLNTLIEQYNEGVTATVDDLNDVVSELIYRVNRLHSVGRPDARSTDVSGTLDVPVADRTLAFNDPTNATFSGLPFTIENGQLTIRVTDSDGVYQDTVIDIDLDGIDNTGAAGFGDDTTLDSLVSDINAQVSNLTVSINPDGTLRFVADPGFDFSFAEDTSGVAAVLGLNTFFTGMDASDVGVRAELQDDPSRLILGFSDGSNETALAIANLRDQPLERFAGSTLQNKWLERVESNAVSASSARARFEALSSVRVSLEAQERALSGVSLDEESINLITYQQQYNGAARFIATVDELTNLLISLV